MNFRKSIYAESYSPPDPDIVKKRQVKEIAELKKKLNEAQREIEENKGLIFKDRKLLSMNKRQVEEIAELKKKLKEDQKETQKEIEKYKRMLFKR